MIRDIQNQFHLKDNIMNPLFVIKTCLSSLINIVTIGCNKNNSSLQSLHLLEAEKKIQTFNSTFCPSTL